MSDTTDTRELGKRLGDALATADKGDTPGAGLVEHTNRGPSYGPAVDAALSVLDEQATEQYAQQRDELRERYTQAGLTQRAIDTVLAVRDEELKRLRAKCEYLTDEHDPNRTLAYAAEVEQRAEAAENMLDLVRRSLPGLLREAENGESGDVAAGLSDLIATLDTPRKAGE